MSWQEDLRRIDGDLAAGKLSKEQYALRREELLAEASSTTAQQPGQAAPPPEQQETKPAEVPPPPPPAPQVPAKDLLTTQRQTTAPSPADHRATERMPHPKRKPLSRKPAQVRPAEVPPPVPQQRPPQQQPLQQQRPQQHPQRQQPTRPQPMFEPAQQPKPAKQPKPKAKGSRRAAAFLALGVVIALAVIGGGLWWLTSDGDENPQANPPPTTTQDSPSTGPSELVDELPQLPGVLNRGSGTFTPDEGAKRKLYGDDEALLLKRQGVKKVTWKGSSRRIGDATMAYVILVAENKTAAKAESTASVLRSLSRVPKVEGLKGYADLPTYRRLSEASNVYRVIYASGTKTVRVGVVQTPGIDEKRLTSELSELLSQITATLPAGER